MNDKSMKSFLVQIADICLQAQCADEDTGLRIAPEIEEFVVTEGQPDCILNVHFGPLPEIPVEELLYDHEGGSWRMYSSGDKRVIHLLGVNKKINQIFLRRLVVFNKEFTEGEVYVPPLSLLPIESQVSAEDEKLYIDPFGYPLEELLIVNLLSQGRGIHVHALGILQEEEGIIFCGVSGAGKSTTAELWKPRNVKILSDDRISVRKLDGEYWCFGTPWHGDAMVHMAAKVPLRTIYFIEKSNENKVVQLDPAEIAKRLIVRCFPTFYFKEGMEYILSFISTFSQEMKCYELQFTPDQRAVETVLEHVKTLRQQ